MESSLKNNGRNDTGGAKLLTPILLLVFVAACAAPTAPVTLRQILPPEINTSSITAIALLSSSPGDGDGEIDTILRDETAKAIAATGRYTVQEIPPVALAGRPEEIAAAAKAAGADLVLGIKVDRDASSRKESTIEATYTWYGGKSGETVLTKTTSASGKEEREAAAKIAGDITRCLMPRGVDRTLYLEYGMFPLTRVGVELARRGIWEHAERKWWTAARANSADSAAYHNLGIAFERRGVYDMANRAYENAFARNPQSPLYIEDISRIHKILGRDR